MKPLLVFSALLAMAVLLTAAAATAPVTYVAHDKVAEVLAKGGPLASGPDYRVTGNRRAGPGQVEVHDKETDIFYVIDGEATVVTGGTVIGGKTTAPDQIRGTEIQGGETRHLAKGDFVVIPAGTPHWFKEVPKSINYYTVKVVKP
ncbi:MAG TPA: cupin domain-containing protein [Terriglobia bacterium]|nr:cupin domain-containing protein [Terriglobia bacterium]